MLILRPMADLRIAAGHSTQNLTNTRRDFSTVLFPQSPPASAVIGYIRSSTGQLITQEVANVGQQVGKMLPRRPQIMEQGSVELFNETHHMDPMNPSNMSQWPTTLGIEQELLSDVR